VNDREETPPTRAQGGGTGDTFLWFKQNDESEAFEAVPNRPSHGPGLLCLDQAKSTVLAPAPRENMESNKGIISLQGCSEIVPALRMPSPPDDDCDSTSLFTTVQRTRVSTGTPASIPSSNTCDIGGEGGNGK
jgi:hypothetical protein